MKYFVALAAAVGLVAAQNYEGVPPCAVTCIKQYTVQAGCSATDAVCQCTPAFQNKLEQLAVLCLIGACSTTELNQAQAAASADCASLSASLASATTAPSTSAVVGTTTTTTSPGVVVTTSTTSTSTSAPPPTVRTTSSSPSSVASIPATSSSSTLSCHSNSTTLATISSPPISSAVQTTHAPPSTVTAGAAAGPMAGVAMAVLLGAVAMI